MPQRGPALSLLVLVAINVLNFYDRQVPGALAEPIRHEFGLSDTQLGLIGSAFIWLYAVVGLPLGILADRWSRKKLLATGLVVWSALTALAGFANSFGFLLVSRLGVAAGEAVAAPSATSWIGDLFKAKQRSKALGLFMLGVPVGGALSNFFSGLIAQAHGWRAAMLVAAAPALLLVPVLLLLEDPRRGAADEHAQATPSMWSVLRIPTLRWIIASGIFLNFNMYAVNAFLPAFFIRVHGVSLAKSGIVSALVYLVGGVAGGALAGMWGDRIAHRPNGRMLSASLVAFAGAPLAYLGISLPAGQLAFAALLLAVVYATMNSYYGFVYASIQDIVPAAKRGTTMAIYFMLMYLCGASMGPYLTGRLSDKLARQAAGSAALTEVFKAIGLQRAMIVIPLLSVALGVVLWLGSRTVAKDRIGRERSVVAAA